MPANARPVPPAVSLLMSVYNGLPHLGAAVESILGQTFTDFEFVIIDDGSKDGSTEHLRRYADLDPRIVLVSRANKGLIASLNEAAALARAPLLARMDADDVSHPTRFARQVEAFASRPGLIALGTWVRFIDASGRVTGPGEGSPVGEAAVANAFVEGTGFVAHPTLMMRREAFEAVGGYRAAYLHAEDLDLLYRLSFAGTIDNLPEHLLDYRTHEHNVSVRYALEMQMMGSLLSEMDDVPRIRIRDAALTPEPGSSCTPAALPMSRSPTLLICALSMALAASICAIWLGISRRRWSPVAVVTTAVRFTATLVSEKSSVVVEPAVMTAGLVLSA